MFANTPEPPYLAVIFTSTLRPSDSPDDYAQVAQRMVDLAQSQPGFLGIESVRDDLGITISYWANHEAIEAWGKHLEHLVAQKKGRAQFYEHYILRVVEVQEERRFGF
jgi:heme-degrading monooxygenase HmoA